jgi:hypothetical protein
MKSLYDYINEARELLGALPFTREQFKEYLIAASDYDDESEIWQFMERTITDTYGEKAWSGFKGWCEGNAYGSDADELYNILTKLPKNRIARVLGAGSFGAAIEIGDNKVCKLFHKNTPMEPRDIKFYKYCEGRKSDVFPRVFKLGSNFVVMEKINMNTDKCKLYNSYLGMSPKVKFDGICMEKLLKGMRNPSIITKRDFQKYTKLVNAFTAEQKEIYNWGWAILDGLKEAIGSDDSLLDLRLANIGERVGSGEIIFFDI